MSGLSINSSQTIQDYLKEWKIDFINIGDGGTDLKNTKDNFSQTSIYCYNDVFINLIKSIALVNQDWLCFLKNIHIY